jgi:MFS family permease
VNFLFSTLGQFFAPAESAMIPRLVGQRRLLQANSLFHLTFTASQLFGLVLLGPLVVKVAGVDALFLGMAATIACCGLLVWPLPRTRGVPKPAAPSNEKEAVQGVLADVKVVARFVLSDREIALAMVQWTVGAILGLVVATLVPGFAQRVLNVRPEDVVFVMAPAGIGTVLGTALLNRWGDRLDRHYLINLGLLAVASCLGAIGLGAMALDSIAAGHPPMIEMIALGQVSGLVPFVMTLALVAGFGFVAVMVPSQTLLQERAPDDLRGRVFAVQLMLSNLASIVPLLVLGEMADLIGADRTMAIVGALIGIVGAASLALAPGIPPWRRLPRTEAVD